MIYSRSENYFISSDKTSRIAYYIYTPEGKPRGLVQICHGMCEHSGRYGELISYLRGRGYAVIIHDQLGHGNSAPEKSDLGYFALERGWIYLIRDLRHVQIIGRQMFGGIPHFFIGHSMGSLVVRAYLAKHSCATDGAVLLGTMGSIPGIDMAIMTAKHEAALHGVKSRPKKLGDIFFGYCNSCIDERRTDYDWLTRDEAEMDRYMADKKCCFTFTASAFKDLFMLADYCNKPAWYRNVRTDLPVLIMSGDEDPVGMYGRGVMGVFRKLASHGFTDAEIKLWDGCRHELIHEYEKEQVFADIADWLDGHTKKES